MLLLHGLSSSPLELRYLARYLQDEGFTICAPVIEGYSAGSAELPMERWIEGAVREYDALAARYERVSVVGLSIGGALALRLIQERPDAQALALLSLTLTYNGWAIPWYRFILDLAYYTPLRHRYRYREAEPFGLRNEALRAKIRARHGARRVQRGRPVRDLAAGAAPGEPAGAAGAPAARRDRERHPGDPLDRRRDLQPAQPEHHHRADRRELPAHHLARRFVSHDHFRQRTGNRRARDRAVPARERDCARRRRGGAPPVVSKALARRLRQLAAVARKTK